MATLTLGLAQIEVGVAATNGTMPGSMAKIGKAYRENPCRIVQDDPEVTEFFEEGAAVADDSIENKKVPYVTFSLMGPDVDMLIAYVGGTNLGTAGAPIWGFDGTEVVSNASIRITPKKGLIFEIPNGKVKAKINGEFSTKNTLVVDFTITPQAVTGGKPLMARPAVSLVVNPTTLAFTAAADATGKTITATSTGNLTYAGGPTDVEWMTVTKTGKVATVKVSANTNGEARTANVTLIADGITAVVPVTQAGA